MKYYTITSSYPDASNLMQLYRLIKAPSRHQALKAARCLWPNTQITYLYACDCQTGEIFNSDDLDAADAIAKAKLESENEVRVQRFLVTTPVSSSLKLVIVCANADRAKILAQAYWNIHPLYIKVMPLSPNETIAEN